MILGINDHDLDPEHGCYNAYISIMLYQNCITLPLLYYIYKLITYITKCWYHKRQSEKNLTLTLILNTNYECPKAYIRLLQLFDIKLMEKNTKIACSSLLHNELWYIIWRKSMNFKTKVTWHLNPISQVGIMEKRILLCFLFPTTPNLCL